MDITGEAVQRAARKVVAAYKQADDPLSDPLQQWQGLSEGGAKASGGPVSKQLPCSQLYHGDIATANATKPGRSSLPLILVCLFSQHTVPLFLQSCFYTSDWLTGIDSSHCNAAPCSMCRLL